jgi:hypothetical protein
LLALATRPTHDAFGERAWFAHERDRATPSHAAFIAADTRHHIAFPKALKVPALIV